MKRPGVRMRRPSRGAVQVTAIAVILAGTGMAVTVAAASVSHSSAVPGLRYNCTYPTGVRESSVPVQVQVGTIFPKTETVGRPIQPSIATVTLTMSHAAVKALLKPHTTSVAATAKLSTQITQNGGSVSTSWPVLTPGTTPVPSASSLVIDMAGSFPPVSVQAPGVVGFAAGSLSVVLQGEGSSSTTTSPQSLPLTCQLDTGQQATFATVRVTGPSGSPAPGQPGSASQDHPISVAPTSTGKAYCPPSHGLPPPTPQGAKGCAYVTGFSNVLKLNGAALIQPAITDIVVAVKVVSQNGFNYLYSLGQLEYHGKHQFPPSQATFLTFGFMPTTATLNISEVGLIKILDALNFHHLNQSFSTITANLMIRVSNVKVNGVPLDVGPNCHTAMPVHSVLRANATSYSISAGGVLQGPATIPSFVGCGARENLDQLLTAPISGPSNIVKMTQGNLCTTVPKPPFGCPPAVPIPKH